MPPSRRAAYVVAGIAVSILLVVAMHLRQREPEPNVLFVLVDTLRADHLDIYGYERETAPNLARLASRGVRFERAYAAAPWTKPSVASIFTGRYPHRHGVSAMLATLPASARTVAERLAQAGYQTAGVVSNTLVDARNGFAQGFQTFDSQEARGYASESTAGVTRRAKQLLERLERDERPFFLFVHYFDPHYEYRRRAGFELAPESAGRLVGGEAIELLRALGPSLTAEEVDFLGAIYDEEIRATDAGIGELLEAAAASRRADDTLVIVAADHGEEIFERGWLGHTRTLYEELIRVPLLIRPPGKSAAARVVDAPVSLVSIAPTILDYAGVSVAAGDFQAPSLRPLVAGEAAVAPGPVRSEVYFIAVPKNGRQGKKTAFKTALIDGRTKLIVDHATKTSELYDLERDPAERENLAATEPERLARMEALLEATRGAAVAPAGRELRPDAAELEELRKLGYVEGEEPTR